MENNRNRKNTYKNLRNNNKEILLKNNKHILKLI